MNYEKVKNQESGTETAMRERKTIGRKTIAVFFGGNSPEYKVSLQSASAVIDAIDRKKYNVMLIGIERHTGRWFLYRGDVGQIRNDCWEQSAECIPVFASFDKTVHGLCYLRRGTLRTISLDAALPILHGKNGEDGTLQGVLELMGVPVIGCGLLSSAVCMDKELAHRIAAMSGIKVPKSVCFGKETFVSFPEYTFQKNEIELQGHSGSLPGEIKKTAAELGYPLFVKPVRSGSSYGITKVSEEQELFRAVRKAFLYDSRIILEETIEGFEVGCALLGTDRPVIGEVDEIELSEGFFDYKEKYTLKTSKIHVPARISAEKAEEIKNTALAVYRALGCTHFARVDMFLTPAGEIYFNEVNTIPGFTSHSRYPNMLKAAGLSFEEVVDTLLCKMEEEIAIKEGRHENGTD